ncbi:hypothetical protein EG19_03930 [Thermoanaerobaculum aquaticum]|uniref:Uncharacterized protein n=1 Tax=Thermoanaerobaculum aquaticum TaxID=1312852 RepID=A0A062Y2H3_9BACT|nr:hypothetical protein EG19_03930 [Thermoanaerobaculum aquaticum]
MTVYVLLLSTVPLPSTTSTRSEHSLPVTSTQPTLVRKLELSSAPGRSVVWLAPIAAVLGNPAKN